MPIPKAKIEEARSIVASGEYAGEGYWRETTRALLSEREEMLALLREAKAVLDNLPWDSRPWTAVEIRGRLAAFFR